MITGTIKSQIDQIWNAFWSGGISNPLEVIEQITYLLFLRRLDDLHTLEENKSARLRKPMERRVFPEGEDPKGRPYDDLRWSRFKHFAPGDMYVVVAEHATIKRARLKFFVMEPGPSLAPFARSRASPFCSFLLLLLLF